MSRVSNPLTRKQVPGTAQGLDVAGADDRVPFHLAEGENLARAPVPAGASTATSIWIWVPVRPDPEPPRSDLAWRAAEDSGIRP